MCVSVPGFAGAAPRCAQKDLVIPIFSNTFIQNEKNGVVYMTAPVIAAKHAFSTRLGGVSGGDFESLNLGFGRGDPDENVSENYRRLGSALGIDVERAAFTRQVHGKVVRTVTAADAVAPETHSKIDCDGLVTATPGLPIFCFTADCVPALLYDGKAGTAGAVHCGWRSSVADIIGEAVKAMCALGSRPEDICAAFGPAIGAANFETDSDVPDAMRAWLGHEAEEFIFSGRTEGKYNVDLRGALAHRLVQLGVPRAQIAVSHECTVESHDKYWSHRYTARHGQLRGSQCAVIEL